MKTKPILLVIILITLMTIESTLCEAQILIKTTKPLPIYMIVVNGDTGEPAEGALIRLLGKPKLIWPDELDIKDRNFNISLFDSKQIQVTDGNGIVSISKRFYYRRKGRSVTIITPLENFVIASVQGATFAGEIPIFHVNYTKSLRKPFDSFYLTPLQYYELQPNRPKLLPIPQSGKGFVTLSNIQVEPAIAPMDKKVKVKVTLSHGMPDLNPLIFIDIRSKRLISLKRKERKIEGGRTIEQWEKEIGLGRSGLIPIGLTIYLDKRSINPFDFVSRDCIRYYKEDTASAVKLFLEGNKLLKQGKTEEAINKLDAAVDITPDFCPFLEHAAAAHSKAGHWEHVIDLCNRAIKSTVQYDSARGFMGEFTVQYDSDSVFMMMMEAYEKLGMEEMAKKTIKEFLDEKGAGTITYFLAGVFAEKMKDWALAAKVYKKAYRATRTPIEGLRISGDSYEADQYFICSFHHNMSKEGKDWLNKTKAKELLKICKAMVRQEEVDEELVRELQVKASEEDLEFLANASYWIGRAYSQLKMYEQALPYISFAATYVTSEETSVEYLLGRLYEVKDELEKAELHYERASRKKDSRKHIQSLASVRYKRIARINPRTPLLWIRVSYNLLGAQMFDEAAIAAKKALQLDDKNPHAYYCLGLAMEGQGHFDEAVVNLRMACNLASNQLHPTLELARALDLAGNKKEALAAWQKVQKLNNKKEILQGDEASARITRLGGN